jgi:hypothetical protein
VHSKLREFAWKQPQNQLCTHGLEDSVDST